GWRDAGAEVAPFSPLADETPDQQADAVYLPGGYPELHAGRLAANTRFLEGVRAAAARGAWVFGECGGYMVLGHGLVDAEGTR
ncbi:cobyrinic acid a,c-diamide synthase, partial [Burkholderia sp. SIMBA_024]